MDLGLPGFAGPVFSSMALMALFPVAKRLQYPSDLRAEKAPEDVFEQGGVGFPPQVVDLILDDFINIKGIAAGINNIAAGIRTQID